MESFNHGWSLRAYFWIFPVPWQRSQDLFGFSSLYHSTFHPALSRFFQSSSDSHQSPPELHERYLTSTNSHHHLLLFSMSFLLTVFCTRPSYRTLTTSFSFMLSCMILTHCQYLLRCLLTLLLNGLPECWNHIVLESIFIHLWIWENASITPMLSPMFES